MKLGSYKNLLIIFLIFPVVRKANVARAIKRRGNIANHVLGNKKSRPENKTTQSILWEYFNSENL